MGASGQRVRFFILCLLSFVLSSAARAATSSFSGTLNLCKGDVFNYYESHGSSYTYTLKSNADSTVASGSGTSSAIQSGKFFSITALKAGKTTIVFNFKKSSSGSSTYTATMTVNVSGERVIEPGKTATVEGWGNSNEKGSSTWSSSNITPSGLVSVKVDSGSTSAMKATLTAGQTANSGTVTIKNVSSNSGSEYIYAVKVTDPRTPVDVPKAVTGLVYDYTAKTGVVEKAGYALTGNVATNAGNHTATATLADGYCWADDFPTARREIAWSIACRKVTVTVIDTNKVTGAEEPFYRTKNENFIAGDPTELEWTAWRTNTSEAVGTYDIVVDGEVHQGGYEITYVGGTLTITEAPPPGPTTIPVTEIPEVIRGVESDDIRIVSQSGDDITTAFTLTGSAAEGVTVTLNPKGAVTIGEGAAAETITVLPELTEAGDKAVEPFEVRADEVDVGVKTIPGLDYKLNRSTDVSNVHEGETVDEKRATTTRTRLRDPMQGGKPEKAFYVIEVGR